LILLEPYAFPVASVTASMTFTIMSPVEAEPFFCRYP
jgi:hypothetical protein